jgi:N-acetylmuramoyl-L-alanine amidase
MPLSGLQKGYLQMIPTHIIVHHSLTADSHTVSWDAIRWYHTRTLGYQTIGYQVGIELVNSRHEILLGRMLNQVGAHCRENGMNRRSIGVCMVGNFDIAPPPPAQLDLLVSFTRSMMELLGIPIGNIQRHSDHATHKSCPGKLFPWAQFIERLR